MNWEAGEMQFIVDNHEKMTQKQIAKALGRAESTISRWVDLLGLKRERVYKEKPEKFKPLQWKKGKHLQGIWRDVRITEVHLGQRS